MSDAFRESYYALENQILELRADLDNWQRDWRRAWDGIERRDVVLDWIAENVPQALELCPYKLVARDQRSADVPPEEAGA